MIDYENDIVFKTELSWEELCEYAKIMIDYENDIVFKPELSWEELCEYAKSKNLDVVNYEDGLCFIRCNGIVLLKNNRILASCVITENRTYEQMKTIIQELYEE